MLEDCIHLFSFFLLLKWSVLVLLILTGLPLVGCYQNVTLEGNDGWWKWIAGPTYGA
jgi:hypothetical protein